MTGTFDLRRPVGVGAIRPLGRQARVRGRRPRPPRRVRQRPPAVARRASPRPGSYSVSGRRLRDGWTRGGSPSCLRVVRRPRRVALALGLVLPRQLQQRVQRAHCVVDPRARVSDPGEPRRDRLDRERLGLDGRDLVPRQRRRDACVRQRPDGVGRRDRPVLGVLVVVEEDAVTLLLPPLRGREVRAPDARRRGRAPAPRGGPPGTSSAARSGR